MVNPDLPLPSAQEYHGVRRGTLKRGDEAQQELDQFDTAMEKLFQTPVKLPVPKWRRWFKGLKRGS